MNKVFILAVILLVITNYTKAQSSDTNNSIYKANAIAASTPFKITKGYYSIHKNAEKLNHQPVAVVIDNHAAPNFSKGFYTINSKHTQLHKGGKSFIVTAPKPPLATKGFYSIKKPVAGINPENLVADVREDSTRQKEDLF